MASTILTVLLIGTFSLVLSETIESTTEVPVVNTTESKVAVPEDKVPEKGELIFLDKLNDTIKQEIRAIIATLDKKYQERKGVSLFNLSRPAVSAQVDVGSRIGIPLPLPVPLPVPADEQFQYYNEPPSYPYLDEPAPLFAYNYPPRPDIRRGSFSIFDRLTPELPAGLPVRQVLEGPINVAIPMRNREIMVYFVNRGFKSVKFTPALRPLSDALTREIRKVGLTLPAALSLRSRYLSWPVKSVTYADPVFMADLSNTATYPTVLFVPEDDIELARITPDIFRIGDFSLLDEGIRYILPGQRHIL